MTNRIWLIIPTTIFIGVVVLIIALFTIDHISEKERQAQQEVLEQAQAHARTSLAVHIAEQDQLFYDTQAQAVQQHLIDLYFEGIQQENESVIQSAVEALESSEDKVLEEDTRDELETAIEKAEEDNEVRLTSVLRSIGSNLAPYVAAVDEAVEEWEEEQERIRIEEERLAEERQQAELRRQEQERQRQQQAAQQQRSSSSSSGSNSSSNSDWAGSSSGTSSGSSSGSSSGGSSSGGASAGGGIRSQAAGIAARHGCASSGIIWDDPRLGSWANGKADWYNNNILLRSSMPQWRLSYVVAHECAHMLQYRVYGGDVGTLQSEMNRIYGGSGFSGLEQNADCITQRWGYSAYNYTQSCGGERGRAAQAIINGNRP